MTMDSYSAYLKARFENAKFQLTQELVADVGLRDNSDLVQMLAMITAYDGSAVVEFWSVLLSACENAITLEQARSTLGDEYLNGFDGLILLARLSIVEFRANASIEYILQHDEEDNNDDHDELLDDWSFEIVKLALPVLLDSSIGGSMASKLN